MIEGVFSDSYDFANMFEFKLGIEDVGLVFFNKYITDDRQYRLVLNTTDIFDVVRPDLIYRQIKEICSYD